MTRSLSPESNAGPDESVEKITLRRNSNVASAVEQTCAIMQAREFKELKETADLDSLANRVKLISMASTQL